MTTIGKLARRFGISRSTLLYYDRIGLLSPSARTAAGYRVYSDGDTRRLEAILMYRDTGLSLTEIRAILADGPDGGAAVIIQQRLFDLENEVRSIREQQRVLLALLKSRNIAATPPHMTKEQWTGLLASAGLSDEDMIRWHQAFERLFPDAHRDFLASLGISEKEIEEIRSFSRPEGPRP